MTVKLLAVSKNLALMKFVSKFSSYRFVYILNKPDKTCQRQKSELMALEE